MVVIEVEIEVPDDVVIVTLDKEVVMDTIEEVTDDVVTGMNIG